MRGRSLWGWARWALAAGLVAVYLASTVPAALRVSLFMLRLPARAAQESLPAARARLFGEDYTRAVDAIRRQLPMDRPYALATSAAAADGGGAATPASGAPGASGANDANDASGAGAASPASGAGDVDDGGAGFWVRYDLAPRRAVFIGRLDQLRDAASLRRELDADLQQVVVATAGQPPRLYDREGFFKDVARRSAGAAAAAAGVAGPAALRPRAVDTH
jgi:hypothetical protein